MRPGPARILLLGSLFTAALLVVAGRIAWLIFAEGDEWWGRSLQNRRAFLDVPDERGSILDRRGRVLAEDEPGFAVQLVYRRFRRANPLGLAVHGTRLAFECGFRVDPSLDPAAWSVDDPDERVVDAARILVRLPVRWIRRGDSPLGDDAPDVGFYVRGLLCAAGRIPADELRVRLAGSARGDEPCADRARVTEEQVVDVVRRSLQDLHDLEAILDPSRTRGWLRSLLAARDRLLSFRCRDAWARSQAESAPIVVARHLTFERVVKLIEERERFAGFDALHDVRRRRPVEPALHRPVAEQLVGAVLEGASRGDHTGDDSREEGDELRLALNLTEKEWERLAGSLSRQLEGARDRRYRHGFRGIEKSLDDVLRGDPGIRHVERDKSSREVFLRGFERPNRGRDVVLSIDAELQVIAERVLDGEELVHGKFVHSGLPIPGYENPGPEGPLASALVVLDPWNGDLLAVAGLPLEIAGTDPVTDAPVKRRNELHPAGSWRGNGRIGSVMKPLLAAEAFARDPHTGDGFAPCEGTFHFRSVALTRKCEGIHGSWSGDPVAQAIGVSCNAFFFQVGLKLGGSGIEAAQSRFGLLPDPADPTALAAEQRSLAGINWRLSRTEPSYLELRGIGYGIESSALSVARAYAALATGFLVTPRTVIQVDDAALPPSARRPLGIPEDVLARVRAGLRWCVEGARGTARDAGLGRFGVIGKTGTPMYGESFVRNNAWFAGYGPEDKPAFAVACVVYGVPDRVHGGDVSARLVARFLDAAAVIRPELLLREAGRK